MNTSLPIIKFLLAGGLMATLAGFLLEQQGLKVSLKMPLTQPDIKASTCETVVQADVELSREQLVRLLAIPERDSKNRVRQIVEQPFCQYPALTVRAGVKAEREAYPLAFEPAKMLVILYEDDEYVGYRFNIR